MNSHVEAILYFWFGERLDDPKTVSAFQKLWFGADPLFDLQIAERFGADVKSARAGKLDHWGVTPQGTLALILLLDQFPRNIHRGTAEAFASDRQARQLALAGIERGDLSRLDLFPQIFFCMPLMHAESLPLQERSVEIYETITENAPTPIAPFAKETLEFARMHRDLIARFGRFPHRNEILGRTSTSEEQAALSGGELRFGQ